MSDRREVVVIGTSAGGFEPLKQLVSALPEEFPATVLIVKHIGRHESTLPEILQAQSVLPVRHPGDREAIQPGIVLIAPPDCHLLVEQGKVRLFHGPKENFSRPAIDPLFRSAALVYREKTIGVVLSGSLDDGTVGLQAIKAYGGIAIVQSPADATVPAMPQSALDSVDVDFCLPGAEIADRLVSLVRESVTLTPTSGSTDWVRMEQRCAVSEGNEMEDLKKIARPSTFTCPECHGSLWELEGVRPQRFRCHVGHAYTASALASAQREATEEAIWAAIRALHEKEALMKRLAQTAAQTSRVDAVAEHTATARQASRHAETLRKLLGEL